MTKKTKEEHGGLDTSAFVKALREEGVQAKQNPYPLLHTLKIFAEGFDIFTRNRGPLCGDYKGYKLGEFPCAEDVCSKLVFLPVLSEPVPGAAEKIIEAIRKVAEHGAKL